MDDLKRALEGLLFASERPLNAGEMRQAFEESPSEGEITKALESLKADYEAQTRGFRLFEIAGGWQLVTDPALESILKRFYQTRLKRRLSQATLETLSVVAYRQPVTRADVEAVRGVNSDAAFKTLLEKDLVKVVGKKEVPGHPMLYGTTQQFLEHFGLKSVKDLPSLKEFTEKDLDPSLLPPEMRREEAQAPAPAADENEGGEQRPIGCANEEEGDKE